MAERLFLYHRVPTDMSGSIIYPLNRLKISHPDIYQEKVKKYENRKYILNNHVPILDSLWNDVIHMSAVDPKVIFETLRNIGYERSLQKFFKIDPESLILKNTVIYWYRSSKREHVRSDFEPFTMDKLEECNVIPETTIDYFREQYSLGESPLLYFHIPHILYLGNIDTTNLEIIEA